MGEIMDAAAKAEADETVLAVVITGGPEYFAAGADFNDALAIDTTRERLDYFRRWHRLCAALENLDKPVIAWTNRSDAAIESDGQLSSGKACPAFALAVGARRGARVLDKNKPGRQAGLEDCRKRQRRYARPTQRRSLPLELAL